MKKQAGGDLEDTDDEAEQEAPTDFTELHRLSYVVYNIDFECASLPVGALRLTPSHELRFNDSFKGLSNQDILKLENYQHFRSPQSEEMKEFISIIERIISNGFSQG